MPQIEISQEAYDLLKLEAEGWIKETSSNNSVETVMNGLASDHLANTFRLPDRPELNDEPIPF